MIRWLKRTVSMLTVLVMLVGILPQDAFATTISQGEEDQISRVEWLSDLVAAFNLYVEADNYPDNYYNDISEEDEFYRDIMLAVEFGAIDIEAGSEFRPNDCATREFAAQSLNALLGFVLENDDYTYSDVDDVVYKEAAQIAVNRGWFVLVEGAFLPNQPITNAEKTAMLGDAQEVLDDAVIEFDHQNTIECDEDVIFIPETTEVSIDTEGEVVAIKDNTQEITVGDVFVVYANEIPFAYKATDIDVVDEYTYISIEDAPDDTIINIDYQGSVDADMTQFVPADATTYSIDNYMVHESATRGVSYDGKTLKANKTVTIAEGVTATFNIIVTNMKVNYRLEKNNYYLSISGDLTYSCNVKGDAFSDLGVSHELILGAVPLGDIGFATIGMVYNLSGEATLTVDNTFESGFAYSNGLRYVGSFERKGYSFSAEAKVKTGVRIGADVSVGVISGSISASCGAILNMKAVHYSSGTPSYCISQASYLYANVSAEAKLGIGIYKRTLGLKTWDVWGESNSPVLFYLKSRFLRLARQKELQHTQQAMEMIHLQRMYKIFQQ